MWDVVTTQLTARDPGVHSAGWSQLDICPRCSAILPSAVSSSKIKSCHSDVLPHGPLWPHHKETVGFPRYGFRGVGTGTTLVLGSESHTENINAFYHDPKHQARPTASH